MNADRKNSRSYRRQSAFICGQILSVPAVLKEAAQQFDAFRGHGGWVYTEQAPEH
jgi:hypothetical protein